MTWKSTVFQKFKLYAVTDAKRDDLHLIDKIEAAYSAGVDIVQLRSKELTDAEMMRLGKQIRIIATEYQKLFFINDRVGMAFALQADGVHVGQSDMAVRDIRRLEHKMKQRILIGKSTHSLLQAKAASREEVDYIGVGPVFATPTKPGRNAVGTQLVSQVSAEIKKPFVAIGGINLNNIDEVLSAGASRVAVVRAIFNERDIYDSVTRFKRKLKEAGKVYAR